MQSSVVKSYTSPKLIIFPRHMVTPANAPLQPNQTETGYSPQRHGNWAQWVAPIITLLIGIISVYIMVHNRNVDIAARTSDEHVNSLIDTKIDTKLNPAIDKVNTHLDKVNDQLDTKIDALIGKIDVLSD